MILAIFGETRMKPVAKPQVGDEVAEDRRTIVVKDYLGYRPGGFFVVRDGDKRVLIIREAGADARRRKLLWEKA